MLPSSLISGPASPGKQGGRHAAAGGGGSGDLGSRGCWTGVGSAARALVGLSAAGKQRERPAQGR